MLKIIAQLEFWLILVGLAAIPNWSWPVFGSVEESRMIVIGLAVGALAILETIKTIMPGRDEAMPRLYREGRGDGISFGFFKNPLNWIISAPLLLVVADWLKTVILTPHPAFAGLGKNLVDYRFFGFGVPWHAAVLPVLLLILWHFLLRSFWSEPPVAAGEGWRSDRIHSAAPTTPTPPRAGGDNRALLKFTFVWLIVFALAAAVRGQFRPADVCQMPAPSAVAGSNVPPSPMLRRAGECQMFSAIGLWFALGSALALVLSALRLPLSAPSLSPPLGKGGTKGGLRLGRLIYVPAGVLIVIVALFIRFEIRIARAAASASRGDFASARSLNPYYPEYALSWAEQEIDALAKADLTADITASKQKVGEIVKELDLLPRPPRLSREAGRRAGRRSGRGPLYGDSAAGTAMYKGSLTRQSAGSGQQGGLAGLTLRTARAWENLGQFAEGGSERALSIYDALIAAQGENPDPWLIIKKALLLEKSGQANQAIEFLSPLTLTLSPQGGRGDNQQGDALSLQEPAPHPASSMPSTTIGGTGQALMRGRGEGEGWKDAEIRYHLGRLLYNSGKEKEASDIWLAILKDDPNYADVNYSLGAYFARQKNYGEARKYLNKVLQLNPESEAVKKKLEEIKGR